MVACRSSLVNVHLAAPHSACFPQLLVKIPSMPIGTSVPFDGTSTVQIGEIHLRCYQEVHRPPFVPLRAEMVLSEGVLVGRVIVSISVRGILVIKDERAIFRIPLNTPVPVIEHRDGKISALRGDVRCVQGDVFWQWLATEQIPHTTQPIISGNIGRGIWEFCVSGQPKLYILPSTDGLRSKQGRLDVLEIVDYVIQRLMPRAEKFLKVLKTRCDVGKNI